MEVPLGADQQILVVAVNRREIAHEIPNVRPNPEFIDFANVDRDAHF